MFSRKMYLLPVNVIVLFALIGVTKQVSSDQVGLHAGSSQLAKFVVALSKPDAFSQGHPVFPESVRETSTSCPMGRAGLSCRRAEARRGVENCPNGACNACDMCAGANSIVVWPNCCKHSGVCCSQLAKSCQKCDKPDLHDFCRKHFKRCFGAGK